MEENQGPNKSMPLERKEKNIYHWKGRRQHLLNQGDGQSLFRTAKNDHCQIVNPNA